LIIGKWIDEVFVVSSENGNLTLEVPFGWNTPNLPWNGGSGPSKLTQWKKLHHKELEDFKKLTGNDLTLKNWREDQQKILNKQKVKQMNYH